MKKAVFTIISVAFLALIQPQPAFAVQKEAGQAAQLTVNQPQPDPRVERLQGFLEAQKSSLSPYAGLLVHEADRLSLDWRLVAAISGVESTYCRFTPANSFNCWGWGIPTGSQSGLSFATMSDGITTVSEGLRLRYFDRGMTTLDEVGRTYAASSTWTSRVRFIMGQIENWQASPLAMTISID